MATLSIFLSMFQYFGYEKAEKNNSKVRIKKPADYRRDYGAGKNPILKPMFVNRLLLFSAPIEVEKCPLLLRIPFSAGPIDQQSF